jgi:hypothetical protein
LQVLLVVGLIGVAGPTVASERMGSTQLAFHANGQTATLPAGTIRLRVIDRANGRMLKGPITWRVVTYGRDDEGRRHVAAEMIGATPEIDLPAAWYIVYAQLPDQELKHPVEVKAGRIFKYTLVK